MARGNSHPDFDELGKEMDRFNSLQTIAAQ